MLRVLIIDDDLLNTQIYANKLEASGYEVIFCTDGEEAQKKIAEKYDLILLDIMMPKVDGVTLLSEIKQGANRQTPVLVHTNLLSEETKKQCLNLGAKEYLIKADQNPATLLQKIQQYMGKAQ